MNLNQDILIKLFQNSIIIASITLITLIISVYLTNWRVLFSFKVDVPMTILMLFGVIGLPLFHVVFSPLVATIFLIVICLLLNVWVFFTMYNEYHQEEKENSKKWVLVSRMKKWKHSIQQKLIG